MQSADSAAVRASEKPGRFRVRLCRIAETGRARSSTGGQRKAWAVLLLFCCWIVCGKRASAVTLDAMIGYGPGINLPSRFRPDTWTPLTVYLSGPGVNGVGQLQVSVHSGDNLITYTRRVPLHDGNLNEVQRFVVQPHMGGGMGFGGFNANTTDITVRLLVDGRKLADHAFSLPASIASETYNILALTRDGSGLNFLAKKRIGLLHRHVNPATLNGFNGNGVLDISQLTSTQILYTDPRALPEMAQGYDAIDVVALADQPMDALTDDQQEALREYVRRGGLLVISGGGDLARLKGQFLADLLPVVPSGVVTSRGFPRLESRYQQSLTLRDAQALTDGTLKPDARALFALEAGHLPLISARSYGAGTVVFTAFDYLAPEFRSWKGAPSFWRDLLRCSVSPVSPRELLQSAGHYSNPYGMYQNRDTSLADALAGQQAANTPAWSAVALFLGAYILLLVPVSYVVLKKLDRRELAWVTMPLLILGFTVTSYLIAQTIKGRLLLANRVVVLETNANSDQASGYAQTTIYSPRRATYDVSFGGEEDGAYRDAAPSEIYSSEQGLTGELTVEHDKTTTLRDVMVKLWDKRSFDTPVFARMGGPIAVATRLLPDGRAQIQITNKTRFTLKDCALVNAQQSVKVGDLAPGETKQQAILWIRGGNAGRIVMPAPPNVPDDLKGADAETLAKAERDRLRVGVSHVLGGALSGQPDYGYTDPNDTSYGSSTNAFIGWFSDPVLDVQVNGQKAAGEEVNLLFAHLPTPSNAPPNYLADANPFIAPPKLSIPDEVPVNRRARQGIFK